MIAKQNDIFENASDVRKNWSSAIDTAVHERPVFINRTHDYVALMDTSLLIEVFHDYKYHITFSIEDDGSYTGGVDELDLFENAPTKEECLSLLMASMRDYAADFYREFNYWSKAINRKKHIPYVLKILTSSDEKLLEDIICRDGKN